MAKSIKNSFSNRFLYKFLLLNSKMGGLKPNIRKIVATLVILLLPIFSERVPLAGGSFVVERYSPATMIYGYTVLWDIVPICSSRLTNTVDARVLAFHISPGSRSFSIAGLCHEQNKVFGYREDIPALRVIVNADILLLSLKKEIFLTGHPIPLGSGPVV